MAKTREEWIKTIQECNSPENIADEVMKLQELNDLHESLYRSYSKKYDEIAKAIVIIRGVTEIAVK